MNRRQRIIVSVTGIFIVLLILIGLTYAYFLTRITGNPNNTSISVTTANLELVYGDGITSILTSSNPIEPGKFSSSKDFTVTNNGNALTDYAVTLEDFSITYANDTVINGESVKAGTVTKMEYPDDMEMTITCTIESDEASRNGQACGNVEGTLPTENSILLTNSIEVDDVHKYLLTLTYVDSGTDQSKDMNKTIKGKIDIIDPKSTIDLTGTVASYQTGDYVEINSTPIKSEIVDGKYKLIGVEPGEHTLYIKYKDANGDVQTRGSQTLTIKKGDSASVSGNVITFTETLRDAKVDVDSKYEINIEDIKDTNNPYSENTETLAYNIINNSMLNKNGTLFVNTPLTTPAKGSGNIFYTSYTDPTSFSSSIIQGISSQWFVYGSEITIDKSGYFKIKNPQIGQFNSIWQNMRDNYVYNYWGYDSEEEARTSLSMEYDFVYKIGSSTTTSKVSYGRVTKNSVTNVESVLSVTADDYGTSYYFRGGVTDNYVNFAGMCWRIVRIEGDGSVKLLLEDIETECNNTSFTGNWSDGNTYVFGYDDSTGSDRLNFLNYTGGLADSFQTFQSNNLTSNDLKKLKVEEWCYDDKITSFDEYGAPTYGSRTRIGVNKKPTLKCSGTKLIKYKDNTNMYVGTLTAEEIVFAGASTTNNYNYYLMNDFTKENDLCWWSLSPDSFDLVDNVDNVFFLSSYGNYLPGYVYNNESSRPAVSLNTGVKILSGEGTLEKPYIISD